MTPGRGPHRERKKEIGAAVPLVAAPDRAAYATAANPAGAGALAQWLRERIEGRLRAEQVAAMWQEWPRNLQAQEERLLALPAHEEERPGRRWWRFWRRAD